MSTGIVQWFSVGRGYGFIKPDDGTRSVWISAAASEHCGVGAIYEGERLSYDVERDTIGETSAINIKPV